MLNKKIYEGINNAPKGGLDATGKIVRDGWVFGIIPETETCEGWTLGQLDELYSKVFAAWEPYAHLPGNLPPEIRERHTRIYTEAIQKAKEQGWDPEKDYDD